jgi:hypothetical protein
MHIAILISVALGAFWAGFALGLVVIGKRYDESMARALDEYTETKSKEKNNVQR